MVKKINLFQGLFLYFISNNIIYNFIISIAFTFYTLRRCKIMNLRGLDIEDEMDYPGQIKVNIIRETRVVDYAK